MAVCLCGCGESVKEGKSFVHGHNSRYAHPMMGKKHSPETLKKLSDSHQGPRPWRLGWNPSADTRRKMSESHKGIPLTEQCRKSLSRKSIKAWANKSEEEKEQWRKNISIGETGKFVSEESKRKNSEAKKKAWKDPEYARKCLVINSPNKMELKLNDILDRLYPGEWKFVGNGEVVIDGKCPDFININGQKKIIELYGERWHQNHDPQDRINVFKPFGYETLVIWSKELWNTNDLIDKLQSFCGGA